MKNRVSLVLLLFFFLGLLLTVRTLNSRKSAPDGQTAPLNESTAQAALARHGFYLTEVSKSAGIEFTHQAPRLDAKLDPIMPEIAVMGASVAVADFDRDGWPDIYVCNSAEGSQNHLYRNNHDGTFRDVAKEMGVADLNQPGTGVCMGAVWGDYDNDGYEDLLIYKWGKCELFHNDHGKGFTRVTEKAGLPKWVNANNAIWLDYNRDGHLDLLISGYYPEDIDLWHLKNTRMMPDSFEYANNGGRKYLLRGRGDGTFEDVTAQVGLNSHRWTLAAAAADLRDTGYPDIFLSNDYGVAEYFVNEGGKRFHEVGKETGVGAAPKSGMSTAFGDVLNQGKFAVYVTNISEPGNLIQGNNLWLPRGTTKDGLPRYQNVAAEMGVELGGWSFGAQFGDLNNDGNLDLFVTNGYVSANKEKSYWHDFSLIAGGNGLIIADAKNWPPIGDMSHSGFQQKKVWMNDGAGQFTDVAPTVGVTDLHDGRSVAMADFWNNGALDVVVANQKGPLLLYKNTVDPQNRWIEFSLEGTRSNRSAIGAQVRLFWDGKQQVQEISGGSGFCAQNDRRVHFGLGKNPRVEKVVIRWPSGKIQTLSVPKINNTHQVKEPI